MPLPVGGLLPVQGSIGEGRGNRRLKSWFQAKEGGKREPIKRLSIKRIMGLKKSKWRSRRSAGIFIPPQMAGHCELDTPFYAPRRGWEKGGLDCDSPTSENRGSVRFAGGSDRGGGPASLTIINEHGCYSSSGDTGVRQSQ